MLAVVLILIFDARSGIKIFDGAVVLILIFDASVN
jgi:hypothetical protein